jgi:hypothetical protein
VLVNYIREFQIGRGVPPAQAYNVTMYVLAALLVAGLSCNLAVRPVEDRLFTLAVSPAASSSVAPPLGPSRRSDGQRSLVALTWLAVCAPLAWGVVKTLRLAAQMFR